MKKMKGKGASVHTGPASEVAAKQAKAKSNPSPELSASQRNIASMLPLQSALTKLGRR